MMTIADAGRPEVMAKEVGKCFSDQPAFHINMKADRRVRVVDVLRLDRTGACDIYLAAQHTDDNRPAERQARAPPFPNSSSVSSLVAQKLFGSKARMRRISASAAAGRFWSLRIW